VKLARHDEWVEVMSFRPPHSTASEGKICVVEVGGPLAPRVTAEQEREGTREYYVSIIGAHWIEREDRMAEDAAIARRGGVVYKKG
jgi:hypothetical protein